MIELDVENIITTSEKQTNMVILISSSCFEMNISSGSKNVEMMIQLDEKA